MMKRLETLVMVPVAVLLTVGLVVILGPADRTQAAGITGTAHDLSQAGYGTDEICVFCHTPHNAQAIEPLWNHGLSVATYSVYSSSTMNATLGQPDGASKLCLSCHDGTVAIDTFGGNTGTHFMDNTNGDLVGTDISNDHPVSFVYDAALATADGGLFAPESASFVDAGHNVPLFAGKMQCSSCHQVHDDTNGKFLRMSNAGSALCLTCHNK